MTLADYPEVEVGEPILIRAGGTSPPPLPPPVPPDPPEPPPPPPPPEGRRI